MKYVLLISACVALAGLIWRWACLMKCGVAPTLSRPRGSARQGIIYAFSAGLMPGSKESTRRHTGAYFRGILFHLAIAVAFIILALLLLNLDQSLPFALRVVFSATALLGAVCGARALAARIMDANLRYLSTGDDFVSVFLVTGFTLLAGLVLLSPPVSAVFYLWTGILLVYLPVSKISHFMYWFFTRFFFGAKYGHRGIIPSSARRYGHEC